MEKIKAPSNTPKKTASDEDRAQYAEKVKESRDAKEEVKKLKAKLKSLEAQKKAL